MDNNPPADDELDPLFRGVFDDPENGTPDNITQVGCLVLARLGKEAWNAWRQRYPARQIIKFPQCEWENTANFSGFNFRDEPIDFQGFVFDHEARFDGAQFGNIARFDGAQFGNSARFKGAQFGYGANFAGARFGYDANFNGTQFGDGARFNGAQFGYEAFFDGMQHGEFTSFDSFRFGNVASFVGAQFGNRANFVDAKFGYDANYVGEQYNDYTIGDKLVNSAIFAGAQFGDFAKFEGTQFSDFARFEALNWASLTKLYSKCPGGLVAAKAWAEARGLSPGCFKSISFAGAKFAGQVDFSGRAFEGSTSFGRLDVPFKLEDLSPLDVPFELEDLSPLYKVLFFIKKFLSKGQLIDKTIIFIKKFLSQSEPVVFGKAPLFHNCKLHQDTTFDGAKFPPPSSESSKRDTAARAYRTLKLAFAQQQATREEQFFFRLELAEEAKRAPCRLRLLFGLYWLFSDYGFSLIRPTLWWLGFMLSFLLIYSLLVDLTLCFPWQADCYIRYDVLQFTLLQALPLPGLDKWSYDLQQCLFPKEGWQSAVLTLVVMFQKTISLLAVFLFSLALRNLFKMK